MVNLMAGGKSLLLTVILLSCFYVLRLQKGEFYFHMGRCQEAFTIDTLRNVARGLSI